MDTITNTNPKSVTEEPEMSIAEARMVPCPILHQPPITGRPMGELLDEDLLTQRDLERIAKEGFKPNDPIESRRIRKAAKILLLEQVNRIDITSEIRQPATIRSPKNWTYTEWMQYKWTFIQGTLFGLLLGLGIAFEIYNFTVKNAATELTKILHYSLSQFIIFAIILTVAIFAVRLFLKFYRHIDNKIAKQIENYRKGRIGEELVSRVLEQTLNNKWSVYLNFTFPAETSSDIDVVLVGPPGVWALEVKNMEGQYQNTGDEWKYPNGKGWNNKKNPTKQAKANAANLSSFLKADNTSKKFIEPTIIWVNIDNKPIIEHPIVPVWTIDVLRKELIRIDQQKNKLAPDELKAINDKFNDLYKQRDNKENHRKIYS